MARLISYDITRAFNESSITDENLLQFVKELYKEGFIKVNVEYNEWTGANYIIYSMTASRTESDECKPDYNKQNGENSILDKKTKRKFLKKLLNI